MTIVITISIALVYVLLGKLGLLLAIPSAGGYVTLVWPASAMAFFVVSVVGYRSWYGLAIGAFALNFLNDSSVIFALATAIGNPLPAILSVYLLGKYTYFDRHLSQPSDVFKFVFIACISTTILSALIGTSALVWDGTISFDIFSIVFTSWWAGDSSGVLLFAPLLLTYKQWRYLQWNSARIAELSILVIIALFIASLVLTDLFGLISEAKDKTSSVILYLLFPICIWVAMRFWQIGTAVFILIFTAFAIYGSVNSVGPFVLGGPYQTLFYMDMFLASLMVVSLTLAATANSLRAAQAKLTKEAVKESEERLRDFSEISADWLWETNSDLQISYLSARYEDVTGDIIADRLGTPILELQNIIDPKENWQKYKAKLEARLPFKNFEFNLSVDSEKMLYLNSNGIPVISADGSFKGYRGSVTDITERKQAEFALLESGQRISRFNKFLTEIIRHQDFINGRYHAFLNSITELLSDVLNVSRVSVWSLDDSASSIECLNLWDAKQRVHSKGTQLREIDFPSYFHALKNDRTLVFDNVYEDSRAHELTTEYFPQFGIKSMLDAPFHAEGAIAGVLCIEHTGQFRNWTLEEESLIISVTDILSMAFDALRRKELEDTLRHAQKMDAVGNLTGGVAHEYNNMLTVILGYAELLAGALAQQPELAKFADEITHAGERGAKLTQKLLAFSQQQDSYNESVNINELLLGQQQMLEKTLTVRIQLRFDLEKEPWRLCLCADDFEGAILNMCINAMHAIDGHGSINIETHNEHLEEISTRALHLTEGDYVVLSINDTGCGIDENTKAKIFDPFFTTKGELGSGLGLSQVYGFVQSSGGTIKVESQLGEGTKMTLYFPRSDKCDDESRSPDDEDTLELNGTEAILLVDDEPGVLSFTSKLLSQRGYQVFCAQSAIEALQLLENETIELLLSDVIMPEMGGYQLAAIVKEQYPKIKIQLASGFASERQILMFDKELHRHLLLKPFNSKTVLKRIRVLLDN